MITGGMQSDDSMRMIGAADDGGAMFKMRTQKPRWAMQARV